MGFLKDLLSFEKHNIGHMWEQIKDDPERIFFGGADPLGGKILGAITGKDYDPIINQWGGPSKSSYRTAAEKGIDTDAAGTMHGLAQTIASIYAGGYGADAVGGALGAGPTTTSALQRAAPLVMQGLTAEDGESMEIPGYQSEPGYYLDPLTALGREFNFDQRDLSTYGMGARANVR